MVTGRLLLAAPAGAAALLMRVDAMMDCPPRRREMRAGRRYDSRPEEKGFSAGRAANPVVFRGVGGRSMARTARGCGGHRAAPPTTAPRSPVRRRGARAGCRDRPGRY